MVCIGEKPVYIAVSDTSITISDSVAFAQLMRRSFHGQIVDNGRYCPNGDILCRVCRARDTSLFGQSLTWSRLQLKAITHLLLLRSAKLARVLNSLIPKRWKAANRGPCRPSPRWMKRMKESNTSGPREIALDAKQGAAKSTKAGS